MLSGQRDSIRKSCHLGRMVWASVVRTGRTISLLTPALDISCKKRERKKMINIRPSFPSVTNSKSWRVKSALCYVDSLVWAMVKKMIWESLQSLWFYIGLGPRGTHLLNLFEIVPFSKHTSYYIVTYIRVVIFSWKLRRNSDSWNRNVFRPHNPFFPIRPT